MCRLVIRIHFSCEIIVTAFMFFVNRSFYVILKMYVNQLFHYSYLLLVKLLAWFDAIILRVESHPLTRVVDSTSKLDFSFKRK